jgi:hypothetical protein
MFDTLWLIPSSYTAQVSSPVQLPDQSSFVGLGCDVGAPSFVHPEGLVSGFPTPPTASHNVTNVGFVMTASASTSMKVLASVVDKTRFGALGV